ncbi:MAG: pyridoxamine 5'-phosphate oxidase family protein [Myxococcales bacterium]|nr:pyridoxamine 5'-phosphate oxidase family protein [Myxococcales bacterium]
MGRIYPEIDDGLRAFIEAQPLFFVATAPSDNSGHLNLSPKGLDSFAILAPLQVAYLDFTGSGAETIAHLRENGRIVVMFCALEGAPKIVRLHGRGQVVEPADPPFRDLRARLPAHQTPARAVIRIDVERISDSCGFGVPRFSYQGERSTLAEWAARKGETGLRRYQREHNARSIDGLPALRGVEAKN